MIFCSIVICRHKNQCISPIANRFINSTSSKGPVFGNHLGIQELPKDCHVPIDISPIINNYNQNSTPPKSKSE